jgi:hypothetical protein
MTPEELTRAGFEGGQHFWQILADKGYTGPADDTEPLQRVVPRKGRGLTEEDLARNRRIANERVFMEQFFGRLSRLWHTFGRSWKYDEAHFDDDLTIACLLTNEHIAQTNLGFQDDDFHRKRLRLWKTTHENKLLARRQKLQASKEKRSQLLRTRFQIQRPMQFQY